MMINERKNMRNILLVLALMISFLGVSQDKTVCFSVSGGFYEESFFLELTPQVSIYPSGGYHIRYTTNGSIPTASSRCYTEPLLLDTSLYSTSNFFTIQVAPENRMFYPDSVNHCIVIRAALFDNQDSIVGEVTTNSYLIRSLGCDTHGLPVLSLCADSVDLYDFNRGILVPGVHYNPNNPDWSGNYFCRGMKWERLCNVEFYELDNTGINQQAGVRTHGESSRYLQQKGLKLYAREQYGKKRFKHRFFEETSLERFKRLNLRPFSCTNGTFTGVQDALAQRVARELNIDALACRQTVLFLNGEYYGIYSIEEVPDEHYLNDYYGVDENLVNIIERWVYLDYGDSTNWHELYQWLQGADLSLDENYAWVNERIDMDNYIDYMLYELYSFNIDWPTNNVRFWQEGNGKWRWVFYDGDACFHRIFDVVANAIDTCNSIHPTQAKSTLLFRKMLGNADFVNRLSNRFYELISGPLHYEVDSLFHLFSNHIESEIPMQVARFNIPYSVNRWETDVSRVEEFIQTFEDQLYVLMQDLLGFDAVTEHERNMMVFPNPFSDRIFLLLDSEEAASIPVSIIDLMGREVFRCEALDNGGFAEVTMPRELPSGMYLLKCKGGVAKIVKR